MEVICGHLQGVSEGDRRPHHLDPHHLLCLRLLGCARHSGDGRGQCLKGGHRYYRPDAHSAARGQAIRSRRVLPRGLTAGCRDGPEGRNCHYGNSGSRGGQPGLVIPLPGLQEGNKKQLTLELIFIKTSQLSLNAHIHVELH